MPELVLDIPNGLRVESIFNTFIKAETQTYGSSFASNRAFKVTMQVIATKTSTPGNMTVYLQGSVDGTLWTNIGTALTFTADSTQFTSTEVPFAFLRFAAICAATTDVTKYWTIQAKLLQLLED